VRIDRLDRTQATVEIRAEAGVEALEEPTVEAQIR
jgi:hypothetical protein